MTATMKQMMADPIYFSYVSWLACSDKHRLTSPVIIIQSYNEHTCVVFKSRNVNKSLSSSVFGLSISQTTLAVTCYALQCAELMSISKQYVIPV